MTVTSADKNSNNNSISLSSDAGLAALGGGGIGTLIVGFAQLIPDSNTWKTVLVIIAPAISVGISTLWSWAITELAHYRQDRIAQDTIARMRKQLQNNLTKKDLPEDMKKIYREKLELLEEVVFNRDIEKIR